MRPAAEGTPTATSYSRMRNQHQCLEMANVSLHVKMSRLAYLATVLIRLKANDYVRIRHITVMLLCSRRKKPSDRWGRPDTIPIVPATAGGAKPRKTSRNRHRPCHAPKKQCYNQGRSSPTAVHSRSTDAISCEQSPVYRNKNTIADA